MAKKITVKPIYKTIFWWILTLAIIVSLVAPPLLLLFQVAATPTK